MNLYLLIALAFGAITVDAPVVRASVILSRTHGEGSQAARKEILPLRFAPRQDDGVARSFVREDATRSEAPLTGAATPRAPATLG
jgi:hypothetical protein